MYSVCGESAATICTVYVVRVLQPFLQCCNHEYSVCGESAARMYILRCNNDYSVCGESAARMYILRCNNDYSVCGESAATIHTALQQVMECHSQRLTYGVATISRLLKMIGLFCKRAL